MAKKQPAFAFLLFALAGVVVAWIELELYNRDVGVQALATCGLAIEGLMTLTIILFCLLGAIIALAS